MSEKLCSLKKYGGGISSINIPYIKGEHGLYSSTMGWGYTNVRISCEDYSTLKIESFTRTYGQYYYPEEAKIYGIKSGSADVTLFSYAQTGTSAYSASNLQYDISSYDAIEFYIKASANANSTNGVITFSNITIE